jgi:hypothetical protein
MAYQLIWTANGIPATPEVYFNVSFPATTSTYITLIVSSPASTNNTTETLENVCFFLDGVDAGLIQSWTTLSSTQTTLNGGAQISFDSGNTWTTFNSSNGLKSDNSTWIPLPGTAISSIAQNGVLAPYDSGTILLRLVIPPSFSDYGVLSFLLGVDFDIV